VPCTATLKTLSALTSPLRSNVWATSPTNASSPITMPMCPPEATCQVATFSVFDTSVASSGLSYPAKRPLVNYSRSSPGG
jgi:hypothetical protein